MRIDFLSHHNANSCSQLGFNQSNLFQPNLPFSKSNTIQSNINQQLTQKTSYEKKIVSNKTVKC